MDDVELSYALQPVTTKAGTGFFSCIPQPALPLEQGVVLLRQRPFDDFLRKHLLSELVGLGEAEIQKRITAVKGGDDPVVMSLLLEVLGIVDDALLQGLHPEIDAAAGFSSLVDLRAIQRGDLHLHRPWQAILHDNLVLHKPLPVPGRMGLRLPYDDPPADHKTACLDIRSLVAAGGPPLADSDRRPPQKTVETALARLQSLKILESREIRHAACLSPIAYLRKWRMAIRVCSGRNRYTLCGTQTSYGKGLSPEAAGASCLMEIVERLSSFCTCFQDHLPDFKQTYRLVHDSYSGLRAKGRPALDPNRMRLDVPYQGESLYWIQGRDIAGHPILIPVQAVFLFSNLDEISLFSGLGSTGLAAGNTFSEAKVSALLEVIERDADSVVPFEADACFSLDTDNPHLSPLFEAYRQRGIQINFQEIVTEFGIPAFRCFVVHPNGEIIKGTGAHLDGRKAVMAALTETPYPFPAGPASQPGPAHLPRRRFEDLPNYDTNSGDMNLAILETLLRQSGFEPVYIDLTRKDVDIPVVKAIVPGLEWLSDFDRLARVSPRLLAKVLKSRRT